MLGTIISLLSGAIGGNVAARLVGSLNQGPLMNSLAGIVGGGLGGQLLGAAGIGGGEGMDLSGILTQIVSGGVGGGVLLAVISFIRNAMGK
ncbi:hypothetical protein [Cochlodiniinecator piscidefendens]|uniref:hypothetical protein n=1 Tax=Cochlodiniinecator piscidefendens TaxID=2715756 RepID=UPI0014083C07|nr:hypothetical protein [Cochlodiniinecator piscidefendens]